MTPVDRLVWTVASGAGTVRVGEDGALEGDPTAVAELRRWLAEPVTVFRRGTVAQSHATDPIVIRPGDGRYVAARIRQLCASGELTMLGCDWR